MDDSGLSLTEPSDSPVWVTGPQTFELYATAFLKLLLGNWTWKWKIWDRNKCSFGMPVAAGGSFLAMQPYQPLVSFLISLPSPGLFAFPFSEMNILSSHILFPLHHSQLMIHSASSLRMAGLFKRSNALISASLQILTNFPIPSLWK